VKVNDSSWKPSDNVSRDREIGIRTAKDGAAASIKVARTRVDSMAAYANSISVVTLGERKMLCALLQWYPGSKILGHGHITLPAYREGLTYRVFSAEQGKSVSLPYRGSEAVRRIDGDADSGTEKKRMLPCNRADRGCVAFLGQHYFAGNGADFLGGAQTRELCRTNK